MHPFGDAHLEFWTARLYQPQFVYIVQGDPETPIKVGTAGNPKARIAGMQTGNPQILRLLNALPGSEALEFNLHQRMPDARIRGEWFGGPKAEELIDFTTELAAWMVETFERTDEIPDPLTFGDGWGRRHRRSGESLLRRRFVDPATLDPYLLRPT